MANFVARRQQLGLSQLAVDLKAGWAEGYQGKLEASLTSPNAKNARRIGWESLPLIAGTLHARLVLVDDGRLGIPTHAETALLLSRIPSPETAMTLHVHEDQIIEHDGDERRTLADMLDEEADAQEEDAGHLDWKATLDGIRRLSAREQDSEARVRAAEDRAKRAEERAAHAELGLRRLQEAITEAMR
ncbi:hypothetical protein ASG51_20270 [Methylobacterium sp. Leaf465]|uniref:hypothetical protein n=1 Tax=Methylobacterium sp. Leaf465 TaxID=1736385 RepID=UPI0006FB5981|nr:hypothetical protein [Methylobacterium sp. Leaf465]KQT82084.1 hypothetical protein ASG51_20270 [Methylobacterium sp. Leaf465]